MTRIANGEIGLGLAKLTGPGRAEEIDRLLQGASASGNIGGSGISNFTLRLPNGTETDDSETNVVTIQDSIYPNFALTYLLFSGVEVRRPYEVTNKTSSNGIGATQIRRRMPASLTISLTLSAGMFPEGQLKTKNLGTILAGLRDELTIFEGRVVNVYQRAIPGNRMTCVVQEITFSDDTKWDNTITANISCKEVLFLDLVGIDGDGNNDITGIIDIPNVEESLPGSGKKNCINTNSLTYSMEELFQQAKLSITRPKAQTQESVLEFLAESDEFLKSESLKLFPGLIHHDGDVLHPDSLELVGPPAPGLGFGADALNVEYQMVNSAELATLLGDLGKFGPKTKLTDLQVSLLTKAGVELTTSKSFLRETTSTAKGKLSESIIKSVFPSGNLILPSGENVKLNQLSNAQKKELALRIVTARSDAATKADEYNKEVGKGFLHQPIQLPNGKFSLGGVYRAFSDPSVLAGSGLPPGVALTVSDYRLFDDSPSLVLAKEYGTKKKFNRPDSDSTEAGEKLARALEEFGPVQTREAYVEFFNQLYPDNPAYADCAENSTT